MGDNQIGDIGVKYISDVLKINSTINEIDLNYNQIGYIGAKYISDALEINTTINVLYLSCNQISEYRC